MIRGHRWSGEIQCDRDEPSFGEYTNRCVQQTFDVSKSNLCLKRRVANVLCPQTACDWTTGRKRSQSNSNQLTAKWGAGGDNVATRHYYYCVMRGSCIGMTSSRVAKPV